MIRGLIDCGSNSIKGFIYEEGPDGFDFVWSHHCYTRLYSYIDENGLSPEGMKAFSRDVALLAEMMRAQGCEDVHIFATAWLRDSSNSEDVLRQLHEDTGYEADVISSREEALCDMTSMRYFSKIDHALGMDMGGGSAQFFEYDGDDVKKITSLPLGALKIKEMFVKGDIPQPDEELMIRDYVMSQLSSFGKVNASFICAMGGSIVEVSKLTGNTSYPLRMTADDLRTLKKDIEGREDPIAYLKEVTPGREYTILPAIVSYLSLSEYFGITEFIVLINGVREGYYIRHFLGKEDK